MGAFLSASLRLGLIAAATGLAFEGARETPKLARSFRLNNLPTVPGESKIIEHFAVQHVAFPFLAVALVVRPASLRNMLRSRLTRTFLGGLALALQFPETLVSFRPGGELFKPYDHFIPGPQVLRSMQSVR